MRLLLMLFFVLSTGAALANKKSSECAYASKTPLNEDTKPKTLVVPADPKAEKGLSHNAEKTT